MKIVGLIAGAIALFAACGGPKTVDPGPTQSVAYYFAGTEANQDIHLHVHWVQNKHDITLMSPCVPQDTCNVTAVSQKGADEMGITGVLPVNLASGSGTFADPGITFTVTTTTGKSLTFTGQVVTAGDRVQMIGTISGPTHPASALTLEKTAF